MNKKKILILSFLAFLSAISSFAIENGKLSPRKEAQLKEDMQEVWPFIQTIKVEYDLVMGQLETLETDSAKLGFLEKYEDYVEKTYFKKLVRLNLRQGKLLLLLIDRQFAKTPYELILQFRNKERADFWQKCAKVFDADLKGKYYPFLHPEIEANIEKLNKEKSQDYILPK